MKHYTIEGRDDLIRDAHSKGLITRDPQILRQERVRQARKQQVQATEERLNKLENQMSRIEKLLTELVNK